MCASGDGRPCNNVAGTGGDTDQTVEQAESHLRLLDGRATQITMVPANLACNGVAIIGGFSRQSGNELKPEGLVRTANGTPSNLANWPDGGVLSIAGGHTRIMRIAAWHASPSRAGMALQARPLLVFDGKVDEPLNDRSRWNRLLSGQCVIVAWC